MEAEIRSSLVSSQGHNAAELVRRYCRDTITDEIHEMINDKVNVDVAFFAAIGINEYSLARAAAEVLVTSDSYSEDVREKASAYLRGDDDL